MAEKEVKLMKGNEVIAHAAIRYGCRRLLRLPYHAAVGGNGDVDGGETLGDDRYGRTAGPSRRFRP